MATKKQNKQHRKRRVRRALNLALDFFKGVSGRKLNGLRYGCALNMKDMRRDERDDG